MANVGSQLRRFRLLNPKRPKRVTQELNPSGSMIRCAKCSEWTELRWQATIRVGTTNATTERGRFNSDGQWESLTVAVKRPVMARLYVCQTCYGGDKQAINIRVSNHTASPSVTVGAVRRELAEATADAKTRQAQESDPLWLALQRQRRQAEEPIKRGIVAAVTSDRLGWKPEDMDQTQPEVCIVCGGPVHTGRCGRS